jgi:hypothetical protein
VNERIAETAGRFEARDAEFVCECGDSSCTQRVETTLAEYERVRGDGATFLLADGHADERIEAVIARNGDHEIVQKRHPRVEPLVRQLDPRAA